MNGTSVFSKYHHFDPTGPYPLALGMGQNSLLDASARELNFALLEIRLYS
jgi:hypothetical protein